MCYKQVNLPNIKETSHLLKIKPVICILREALESDLVSYILKRVYQRRQAKQHRNVLCADTTNHNSVLKRSHGFINPFDCIVNIPFKTVPYQVMFCPIREKRKGFMSCSTLRAVHIFTHTEAVAVHFTICRFCTKELNHLVCLSWLHLFFLVKTFKNG